MIPLEENELKTLTASYLVVTNPATGESSLVVTSGESMFSVDLKGRDVTALEDVFNDASFWPTFFSSIKEALPVV